MTDLNEARQKIDFIQPPTGEQTLSEQEKLRAARGFGDLVQDLLAVHALDVVTDQSATGIDEMLKLEAKLGDNSMLTANIASISRERFGANPAQSIKVAETDPNGNPRKNHTYELGPGEKQVTRRDVSDLTDMIELSRTQAGEEGEIEGRARTEARFLLEHHLRIKEIVELESQFGLNLQPVSPQEIAQLRETIETAFPPEQ